MIVAGTASGTSAAGFGLLRLTANGSLDPTFGSGGEVLTQITPDARDLAFGLDVQGDGKLVAAGTADYLAFDEPEFAVARYTANGTLDAAFGTDGKVTTSFESGALGLGMALDGDQRLILSGATTDGELAVARYWR